MALFRATQSASTALRKATGRIRTDNLRFTKPLGLGANPSRGYQERGFSESGAESVTKPTPLRAAWCRTDPGLARLVEAWSTLPEAIRVGIVAMIDAAAK